MLVQDLLGLHNLREFRGEWLFYIEEYLGGHGAEALWAVAFGWPQLLDFELTECTMHSDLGDVDMQKFANSPLRLAIRHANAAGLVSFHT